MKWIKNLIGNLQGYSHCYECRDHWNCKEHQDISITKTWGVFFLCKECFQKLPTQNIIEHLDELLNKRMQNRPIEYTENYVKKIRLTLIKNIKGLKQQ